MASNERLEEDNDMLQHEVDAVKARLQPQQVTDQ